MSQLFARSVIYTLVSPLQPENASYPILVTLSGIVTLVSPLQLENAPYPNVVSSVTTTFFSFDGM